jgi:hypothetical protein
MYKAVFSGKPNKLLVLTDIRGSNGKANDNEGT